MLDKEKIRVMAKLSSYEQGQGKEYIKIGTYFKKDYISLNALITVLWVTLGYVMIAGLYALVNIETLLQELSMDRLVQLIAIFVAIYLVVVIIFCVISSAVSRHRHQRAKQHMKRYYRDLFHLEKLAAKETDI